MLKRARLATYRLLSAAMLYGIHLASTALPDRKEVADLKIGKSSLIETSLKYFAFAALSFCMCW